MSAVTTRPRAAKKAVAQPTWPELAKAAASRLSELMSQASQADGSMPGPAFKALDDAESILIFMAQAPLTDSLWQPNDPWYALALVEGVDALMKQAHGEVEATGGLNAMQKMLLPGLLASVDAIGLALLEAPADLSQLNVLEKVIDSALTASARPQPAHDAPGAPAQGRHDPMPAAGGESEEDTPVELAWFRAAEAVAILSLTDNSDAVFGARHLIAQAIELMRELAPAGKDTSKLEQASLLMCYAVDIMAADGQAKEDQALDGAITLARVSKEHLDGYWAEVERNG